MWKSNDLMKDGNWRLLTSDFLQPSNFGDNKLPPKPISFVLLK